VSRKGIFTAFLPGASRSRFPQALKKLVKMQKNCLQNRPFAVEYMVI
jgi:hypothetical protein